MKPEVMATIDRMAEETTPPLPILHTKIYMPRALPNPVARRRLFERLDEGSRGRLTLVSAPPGFGKTTLVSEWLRRTERCSAWVSLDDGDNELVRFLTYLVAALRTIDARIGETTLGLLAARQTPPTEAILTSLLNDLLLVPDDLVVVLDDYHLISSTAVHDALAYLLDHLPAQLHLIITSRIDPPLPLARLRGRRQLLEIRAGDLRFTPEEASDFLNDVVGLSLSAGDIAALDARTEGWIAGLQLAALSMRNRSDVSGFIHAFTGSHRHIVDYLAEEVLQRQSPGVQRFLLETSILERLTGSLCDSVTGGNGGGAMLRDLEEANLFLIPLDEERNWYRYHHLFAEFLRGRLTQTDPHCVAELHRRASLWHESECLITEAIAHAVAGGDHEGAMTLVMNNAETLLLRSEIGTLRSWLTILPEEQARRHAGICLLHGWTLMFTGQFDAIVDRLHDAETGLPERPVEEHPFLQGNIVAMRAYLARNDGDWRRSIELSSEAMMILPPEDTIVRGAAVLNMAFAYLSMGNIEQGSTAFHTALDLNRSAGNIFAVLTAIRCLGRLHVLHGELHRATAIYQEGLRYAEEYTRRDKKPLIPVGMIYLGLGEIEYERNRLETAYPYLLESIRLSELSYDIIVLRDSSIALARLYHARNEHEAAMRTLDRCESMMRQYRVPEWMASPLATYRTRLQLAVGDLTAPERWMEQQRHILMERPVETTETAGGFDVEEMKKRTIARVWIARQQYAEAVEVLSELIANVEKSARNGSLIISLNVFALALEGVGRHEAAMRTLLRALELAEPEDYIRAFLDDERPLQRLLSALADALDNGTITAPSRISQYARRILEEFRRHEPPPLTDALDAADTTTRSSDDPDALSERELEVLRLVAEGLSNKEIADRLFLASGTVKRHIHNIYEKLGAAGRTHAVALARERGRL